MERSELYCICIDNNNSNIGINEEFHIDSMYPYKINSIGDYSVWNDIFSPEEFNKYFRKISKEEAKRNMKIEYILRDLYY